MKTHTVREILAAAVLTLVVSAPATIVTLRAQGPTPQDQQGGFPDLIGMLKATPGVLGVDAARGTLNGKMVIFAWFENKKAALTWYYSAGHQALMTRFSGGARPPSGPMPAV